MHYWRPSKKNEDKYENYTPQNACLKNANETATTETRKYENKRFECVFVCVCERESSWSVIRRGK